MNPIANISNLRLQLRTSRSVVNVDFDDIRGKDLSALVVNKVTVSISSDDTVKVTDVDLKVCQSAKTTPAPTTTQGKASGLLCSRQYLVQH